MSNYNVYFTLSGIFKALSISPADKHGARLSRRLPLPGNKRLLPSESELSYVRDKVAKSIKKKIIIHTLNTTCLKLTD